MLNILPPLSSITGRAYDTIHDNYRYVDPSSVDKLRQEVSDVNSR